MKYEAIRVQVVSKDEAQLIKEAIERSFPSFEIQKLPETEERKNRKIKWEGKK